MTIVVYTLKSDINVETILRKSFDKAGLRREKKKAACGFTSG
ncbi:MAG: hypothetical protein ABSG53_30785 [Thermoguttaceae bacterium]|jgi:hypothetical protein